MPLLLSEELYPWSDVFQNWQNHESREDLGWERIANAKGYGGPNWWKEWRMSYLEVFRPQDRLWSRYLVQDPTAFFDEVHCGPYASSWLKMTEHKGSRQMKDLAKLKDWMAITKLQDIVNGAPEETEIVAARLKSGVIMLIEGHHRVIAKILNPTMSTRFHLALTQLSEDDQRFYESWR